MKSEKRSVLINRGTLIVGSILLLSAAFIVSASSVMAADFWETKDYTKWSNKECASLLTNSPWAYELKLYRQGKLGSSDGAEGQAYVKYNIRFISALPIRQAQVRQLQIANKYDSLSDAQKQAFDKQTEAFLYADYGDKVVIGITYETNIQQNYQELSRYWQSQTAEVMANSVFLTPDKGSKARLVRYNPPQGAQTDFAFIFPREVDGNPLLSDENKNLILEFTYPVVGGIGDGKGYAEFKVKKMMIKSGIIY
jgi:hypothetical protein